MSAIMIIAGVLCLAGQTAGLALDEPAPVRWRGDAFGAAVEQLAERCEVPYIYDASVTPAILDVPIRMEAEFLSGRQSFVWLARLAGLEAVEREGAIVIARPERLPIAWRIMMKQSAGRGPLTQTGEHGAESEAGGSPVRGKRDAVVDVEWIDVPLSRVGEDLRTWFGVDLVVSPRLSAEQPLIHFAAAGVGLDVITRHLAIQLHSEVKTIDGALAAGFETR